MRSQPVELFFPEFEIIAERTCRKAFLLPYRIIIVQHPAFTRHRFIRSGHFRRIRHISRISCSAFARHSRLSRHSSRAAAFRIIALELVEQQLHRMRVGNYVMYAERDYSLSVGSLRRAE